MIELNWKECIFILEQAEAEHTNIILSLMDEYDISADEAEEMKKVLEKPHLMVF